MFQAAPEAKEGGEILAPAFDYSCLKRILKSFQK